MRKSRFTDEQIAYAHHDKGEEVLIHMEAFINQILKIQIQNI